MVRLQHTQHNAIFLHLHLPSWNSLLASKQGQHNAHEHTAHCGSGSWRLQQGSQEAGMGGWGGDGGLGGGPGGAGGGRQVQATGGTWQTKGWATRQSSPCQPNVLSAELM
jgi:hypothetical protein